MSEDEEPKEQAPGFIRRYPDPRQNAQSIRDHLDAAYVDDRLSENRYLSALCADVFGLLSGISQGTIKTGQPRIVEQLIRIVQNYPQDRDPDYFLEAIAAASEFGLTAEGHSLPGVLRFPNDKDR